MDVPTWCLIVISLLSITFIILFIVYATRAKKYEKYVRYEDCDFDTYCSNEKSIGSNTEKCLDVLRDDRGKLPATISGAQYVDKKGGDNTEIFIGPDYKGPSLSNTCVYQKSGKAELGCDQICKTKASRDDVTFGKAVYQYDPSTGHLTDTGPNAKYTSPGDDVLCGCTDPLNV